MNGDTALIGAPNDDYKGSFSGSAYVFTRSGGTWTQQTKLTADDGAQGDQFGYSVSLYGDTAVIGAFFDDDKGTNSGSAYVFTRSVDGTWTQQTKLTADDGAAADFFGESVSVNGDTAVIGATYIANSVGSAYVFTRSGDTWMQQAKLIASDGAEDDYFGYSVSLYGDTAVIGAPGDDSKGSAYVFARSGSTWMRRSKMTASDGTATDFFGESVSVYGDTAVIGAVGDDSSKGSAYVFSNLFSSELLER